MPTACVDGVLQEAAEATIPVTDDGLLRGDGVFEVVRLYGGRPFALTEHLDRMQRSAAGLRLPLDVAALRADVGALLDAAAPGDGCLRIVATRGGRRILLLEPLPPPVAPLRLAAVTFAPSRLLDQVKSLSYGANMLATRVAQERGFDEALLVTPHGRALEGPRQAFFCVVDGALCTPPLADHVLDSITRRRVLAVAEVVERPVTLDELLDRATEAFLVATTREVAPVGAIEDRVLEPAPGPVTTQVAVAVRERIDSELAAA